MDIDSAAHRVVTVGKLQLTLPAAIVAASGFVVAIAMAWLVHPILGIAILPGFFLAAYNVNCVTVGHCTTWAWILTSIYTFYTLLIVVIMILKPRGGAVDMSKPTKSPKTKSANTK